MPAPPILGQDLACQYLQAALQQGRVNTAYCLAGPEGVGRAGLARWFAQALLCPHRGEVGGEVEGSGPGINKDQIDKGLMAGPCGHCASCRRVLTQQHPDLRWVEPTFQHQGQLLTASAAQTAGIKRRAAPQVRLAQIRQVATFVGQTPLESPRAVVVIEGAETLAEGAANALLKTLEEPGAACILLITTAATDLLPTLVSRCQLIPLRRLAAAQVAAILAEQGYPPLSPALLSLAQGSPGQAIAAYTQWQALPPTVTTSLERWPATIGEALQLSQAIAKSLDLPAQLWLLDYLQHHFWQETQSVVAISASERLPWLERLEDIRRHLVAFGQPQLAWEVGLAPLT